jgi:hypothetical protein
MIDTTKKWGLFFSICLIISAVFLIIPQTVFAVQYQQCLNTTDCTVGEFLYDDEYQPISVGTTCTLTSRYPNGTLLVNAANMTATADGWYSYNVGTSGLAAGIYRGQMCCNPGTDYLCLDKSFEITNGLNSSLIADIWSYPSRSLNSFADIISGIWTNPSRSLTTSNLSDGSSLATTTSLDSIGTSLTTLSTQISAVQTNLVTIESKVDTLQTSVGEIQTDTDNILTKWGSYSVTDILNYVDTVEVQLGNNTQTCSDNSVFGHIQCLIDKWGASSASAIYTAANNAYNTATSIRSELNFNGKSTTAYDEIIALKAYVDTIEGSIGATTDTSSTASIFGRIKQVKEAVDAIDNSTLDLDDLMAKWGTLSATDIYDKVKNLSSDISAVNTVSNVTSILNIGNTTTSDLTSLKNQVSAMKALLEVNRLQLETLINKPIIKTWLEQGSIIFKHLITNPSALVAQKTPFVYYFPPEVKQEDIIKKSESLEIKYDSTKSLYYATGDFDLSPKETVIVDIEVKDIWTISKEKLTSLKTQATELYAPLKKTSYFAQGATLYSDIVASLDRIDEIQKKAILPEDKIKIYAETKIELESVNRKIDSLKNIVSQAGSIGTLSGFIGGVQTLAVWGIIVILVAGFVFLGIYIRSLNTKNTPKKVPQSPVTSQLNTSFPSKRGNNITNLNSIILVIFFGASFGASSTIAYYYSSGKKPSSSPQVLSAVSDTKSATNLTPVGLPSTTPTELSDEGTITTVTPTLTPTEISPPSEPLITVVPELTPTPSPPQVGGLKTTVNKVIVIPNINSFVNLRSSYSKESELIGKIVSGQELVVTEEKFNELGEKWLKVSYQNSEGWILGQLTQVVLGGTLAPTTTFTPSAKINIVVPSHDVVYIYSRPSFNASITSKISENQTADILVETKRWVKIILLRTNVEGWISQDFIEKILP